MEFLKDKGPGILFCLAIAVPAWLLGQAFPVIGGPIFAILAGMVYALENPNLGIIEADEMDFRRCLEIQSPYLGPLVGRYTDWTPLTDRPGMFPEDIDTSDPWQFRNILVR